jgi:hypothetical protein
MSQASPAGEVLYPVADLPRPAHAGFYDARLTDDDVAKLKQRVAAEQDFYRT